MAPRRVSVRGRGLPGLAVLVLSFLLVPAVPAAPPAAEETLPPGEVRERPIAAGEAHAWRVAVPPGTAVAVTVEMHDIDLAVEARRTGDAKPVAVHGSHLRWGREALLLEGTGEYRIEIHPWGRPAWPGRYILRSEPLPARPAESARREAFALRSQAGQEAFPDTEEAQKQAEATYRRELAAWRALDERAWEAESQVSIAMLEQNLGQLPAAAQDFQSALALWRELKEPDREAEALEWLGVIYLRTEGAAKARETLESSLSLWQTLGDRFDEAETHYSLCSLERDRGSLPAALACFEENLAFFRGLGETGKEAEILNSLGGVYDLQGEPDDALASYEQARALWHTLGDRAKEATVLNNVAVVHRTLGEWQEALHLYDQVREVLGPLHDRSLEAARLNNIGYVYNSVGEPQRALSYLLAALKLRRAVADKAGEISTLNNLGTAWRQLGDPAKALDWHRQALDLAVSRGDVAQQAISHLRLAEVRLDRCDAAAALRDLDAALALVGTKGNRRITTEILHQKGRALALAGREREALPVLREALDGRQAVHDRAGEAETLYELALSERGLGLTADALSHARAAVARVEELRIGFLNSDLRTSFLATRRRAYSVLIDLLMDRQDGDREAFAISESARARTLLDALRSGSVASTATPRLLTERTALLHKLSAKIDQRWKQSGERAAALQNETADLLAEVDRVETEIRRQDPRFAAFSSPKPVPVEEIDGWLEPGTMLVEYSLGADRSFVWALAAGQIHAFVLPGQKEIETLARRVYEEMSTAESGNAHRGEAAEALSRILLGPVWSGSPAAQLRRLIVVPEGALGALSFAALPVPAPGRSWQTPGGLKPLLEHVEVVYIPSATTLAVQRQRLEHRAPAAKWAAVLADPVFAADDPRLVHRSAAAVLRGRKTATEGPLRGPETPESGETLERLPSTRIEAESVAGLAPAGQVWLGLGLEANREAVLSGGLRDYRVLHFATHAVADTRNPELSGLFLSQVDAAGRPRDGFLGLSDIYDLDLGADLVVLSGCRTALGKEVRGEGVMGLTRGFLYAGVPRVMASLWRVQDRATSELMTRFYKAMWRDHLAPAAALREAQRSLRREPRYRDPYSWAGFVLQGDWQ
jgi:CHAT domain-containing protein/Flp pilus assembly protein TadD